MQTYKVPKEVVYVMCKIPYIHQKDFKNKNLFRLFYDRVQINGLYEALVMTSYQCNPTTPFFVIAGCPIANE